MFRSSALLTKWSLLTVLIVTGQFSQLAWSGDKSAAQWVDEMSRAFKDRNYHGKFMYWSGKQINTLEILHKVKDGEEFERIRRLSGKQVDVIRADHPLFCLHPADHFARLEDGGAFAAKFREGKSGFVKSYTLSVGILGKVAGRPAQQIIVTAQDRLRYDYELWLDQESAFLLKSALLGPDGAPLEVFEFVDLQLGIELADSLFELATHTQASPAGHAGHGHDRSKAASDWHVTWAPQGFTLASRDVQNDSEGLSPMDVMMYADGLATYTVFVEGVSVGQALAETVSQEGATIAFSQPMVQSDAYWVTVVGELPLDTIKRIASSVSKKH